jgi:hypothetical protein
LLSTDLTETKTILFVTKNICKIKINNSIYISFKTYALYFHFNYKFINLSLKMDKSTKIPKKLLKTMICCLSDNEDHIVENAKLISCGGNACEKCLENLKFRSKLCNYCNDYHSIQDYSKSLLNPNIQHLIDSFQFELIEFFKNKLNNIISSMKDDKFEKIIDENFNLIQVEVEIQIESAKRALENIRNDLMNELSKIRSCWRKYFIFNLQTDLKIL